MQFAALVGIGLTIVLGVLLLVPGQVIEGLAVLLLGTPSSIGQFVALGLAVHYAEQRSS